MPILPTKFHQNIYGSYGEVAFIRYVNGEIDSQTDKVVPMYSHLLFLANPAIGIRLYQSFKWEHFNLRYCEKDHKENTYPSAS